MKLNKTFIAGLALAFLFSFSTNNVHAGKKGSHGSKSSSSGHYSKGSGSSHKGGSYKNSGTGNHYKKRK